MHPNCTRPSPHQVLSSDPTSGLCYVRHPTDCLGLLCDERSLLPLRMHEAACRLTRVARARLRQRKCKQRIACLALQAACRLFFALRRARLRRAQLNAMPLVAEEAVISLEMRRTSALEQLADLMERLKESDTDGMAMTTLQGERVTAIRDCDCH